MVFRWKNKYTVKYNNKKNKLRMEYRVLIALNSIGKRRVGDIIALFERVGFEILNFRKVKRSSRVIEFPDIKTLVLENQLNDLDAMSYYKSHFSLKVLRKKLEHFRNNHVELVFDSGENIIDVHDLWEILKEKIFMKGKKLPILFVLTDNGVKIDDFILDDEFCSVDAPQLPTRVMNIRLCHQESSLPSEDYGGGRLFMRLLV